MPSFIVQKIHEGKTWYYRILYTRIEMLCKQVAFCVRPIIDTDTVKYANENVNPGFYTDSAYEY